MTTGGEWLLANGLGGYALGPRTGPPTRGYHGWLIAATRPPDGRVLLVGAIEAVLVTGGTEARLDEIALAPGVAARDAIRVRLDAELPPGVNAIALRWTREDNADGPSELRLTPHLAGRDHHPGATVQPPARVTIEADGRAATVTWPGDVPELRVAIDRGRIVRTARAITVHYPEESARGTAPDETLHDALMITVELERGESITAVLGTEAGSRDPLPHPAGFPVLASGHAARDRTLIETAGPRAATDRVVSSLVLAADRFLVRRPDPTSTEPGEGVTVIAGYPWFGDWGRDTMISLPGLALATGRHAEARRILRTWAGLVRDGLLPNHFPEAGGGEPAYHAIDAPLWFVHALGAYERATGDGTLAHDLRPAVQEIVTRYRDGTRFGIGMDPADGLIRGGAPGLQLTWMDAKVDGVVITPRHGKPVEIQALWIEALGLAAGWADAAGDAATAVAHRAAAARARTAFRARYEDAGRGWLRDVVDGPDGDDDSLRPNQLLALSLIDDLVDPAAASSVLDAVGRHLVVPGGVRTLAPFERGYRPAFQGPPAFRDSAYHQGPAWTWLLGPWITAVANHRGRDAARVELAAAVDALDPARTGAIPELLEPEPPHAGRGCPWQAWGVAELLRCAVDLAPSR